MPSQETYDTALTWYQTGIGKLENHSESMAISYLDKAIAVFADSENLRLLTHARHYRLLALKFEERYEEVERGFSPVMEGYTRLEDHYGKNLLLIHLAETLAEQGRWERASSYLNLAEVMAENYRNAELLAHACVQQARLFQGRDNHVHALRLLQRAEQFTGNEGGPVLRANLRHMRGEVLFSMGEISEATGLLEDAQALRVRENRPQDALKSLTLLKQVYENSHMAQELERVTNLMHICGQQVVLKDGQRRELSNLGPPIEPRPKGDDGRAGGPADVA